MSHSLAVQVQPPDLLHTHAWKFRLKIGPQSLIVYLFIGDADNLGGELYGTGSRCFLQGGPWSLRVGNSRVTAFTYGSGCYRVSLFISHNSHKHYV